MSFTHNAPKGLAFWGVCFSLLFYYVLRVHFRFLHIGPVMHKCLFYTKVSSVFCLCQCQAVYQGQTCFLSFLCILIFTVPVSFIIRHFNRPKQRPKKATTFKMHCSQWLSQGKQRQHRKNLSSCCAPSDASLAEHCKASDLS